MSAKCRIAAERNHAHNVEFAELMHGGCELRATDPLLVLTAALQDVFVAFAKGKDMVVTV